MGNARSVFDYPQNVLRRFSADTPRQTVRAVFPHTALRVGLHTRCGLESDSFLKRLFKSRTGMTLREWRKKLKK